MAISRRQAREWAVQMLTAADLNPPDDLDGYIADCWEEVSTAEDAPLGKIPQRYKQFAEERVRGVWERRQQIDDLLEGHLTNWRLDRLGTVERAVLRLGVWEILYTEVPAPVVINEAIDLVNWFSSPVSRALVNGVLDKIAHEKKGKEK